MTRTDIIIASAAATIAEGHILHLRADALPGKRSPKRDAMPRADMTVGPCAGGGFLLVDYARVPGGLEEHHATAAEAVRGARKLLSFDRIGAMGAALVKVHGVEERGESLAAQDGRGRRRGLYS